MRYHYESYAYGRILGLKCFWCGCSDWLYKCATKGYACQKCILILEENDSRFALGLEKTI